MDTFSEKISPGKNLLVGFQHVLAMCPGTIAVPLILSGAMGLDARTTAFLVSANLFTSGIAILIQVFGLSKYIGSRYPIILGSSFAPLAPMIMIGNTYGLPTPVSYTHLNENEELELAAIQSALNKNVDGIIICPAQKTPDNLIYLKDRKSVV